MIGRLKRPSVTGLMRETLLSPSFATQTDRLPYAIADGAFPATVVAMTFRDAGSIRETCESPNATQTDPAAERFRELHARLHEAVFAVLEVSEGEIRYLI